MTVDMLRMFATTGNDARRSFGPGFDCAAKQPCLCISFYYRTCHDYESV
jgi:hypothetical protein